MLESHLALESERLSYAIREHQLHLATLLVRQGRMIEWVHKPPRKPAQYRALALNQYDAQRYIRLRACLKYERVVIAQDDVN